MPPIRYQRDRRNKSKAFSEDETLCDHANPFLQTYSLKLSEGDAQVGGDIRWLRMRPAGWTALSASQLIGQAYATKIMIENASQLGFFGCYTPVDFRTQVWYNPDLVSANFTIPGVIGLILYVITTMLTASTIVRKRERGTIRAVDRHAHWFK